MERWLEGLRAQVSGGQGLYECGKGVVMVFIPACEQLGPVWSTGDHSGYPPFDLVTTHWCGHLELANRLICIPTHRDCKLKCAYGVFVSL